MPDQSKNSSSKRFRPKVPLDQRKRIDKACTSCRSRKRRCVLITPDNCQNCDKIGSSCVFEAGEDIPASSGTKSVSLMVSALAWNNNLTPSSPSSPEDSIDHEDVATQFNKSYPEIGLEAHHAACLAQIMMDSLRRAGVELSPSKADVPSVRTEGPSTQGPKHTLACSNAGTAGTVRPNLTTHTIRFTIIYRKIRCACP